jgi:hypothetical protein
MVTFKFRGEHFSFKQKTFGIGNRWSYRTEYQRRAWRKDFWNSDSFCQRNKVAARFLLPGVFLRKLCLLNSIH